MFRMICKTLWARRRRNGWLLAELILVCVLSWVIFDPVIVLTHDRLLPLGYQPDRLALVSINALPRQAVGYDSLAASPDQLLSAYYHLVERARQHPDVQDATILSSFAYPGSQGSMSTQYQAEGDTTGHSPNVFVIGFYPRTHFFETYGFRPGKGLSPAELSEYPYDGDKGVVLDENTLRYYFHTDDPRGKRFWSYDEKDTTYIPIVGTVGTVRYFSDKRPMAVAFRPQKDEDAAASLEEGSAQILVRLKDGVGMDRFLHEFRPWMLDNLRAGNLYARTVSPYRQAIADSEAWSSTPIYRRNLLVAVFFLVNLCLGVAGTFWLQTRTRREEVGVMLSFGATPGRIVRQLLGEGALLTTVATLVGCFIYLHYAMSEGLSRGTNYFANLRDEYWTDFFGTHFLIVSLIVYAVLLAVVSVGVWLPARKISRIPPTEALRDE